MEITTQIRTNVVDALMRDMQQRGVASQSQYSKYIHNLLDIPFDKAALSTIKKVEGHKAIRDSSWLKLAKHFNLLGASQWNTAITATYTKIHTALDLCKDNGIWQVLCDGAGLGKSYAAAQYAAQQRGTVIYIDCSDCGSKSDFINEFARLFGLERTSTYNKLWREVVDELLLIDRPLLILDEFGDVAHSVITLLKSLYNRADAGDHMELGCYFIGANNLKKRLENGRKFNKQSYAEFWSRFDNNITSLGFARTKNEYLCELNEEIEAIVDANLPAELADRRTIIVDKCLSTMGVRAVRKEIALQQKIKHLNAI